MDYTVPLAERCRQAAGNETKSLFCLPSEADHLAALLACNSSLTHLELAKSFSQHTVDTVARMTRAVRAHPSLISLDVSSNHLLLAAAVPLCELLESSSSKVVHLSARDNPLGDVGVERIVEAGTRLVELDLRGTHMGQQGVMTIAKALQSNAELKHLWLAENRFGDDAFLPLVGALSRNSVLRTLDVSSCNLRESIRTIGAMLCVNTSLAELYLAGNEIGVAEAKALGGGLCCTQTLLSLSVNSSLGDGAFPIVVAAMEQNRSIKYLNLGCSMIKEDGIEALIRMLQRNTTLQVLWVPTGNVEGYYIPLQAKLRVLDAMQGNASLLEVHGVSFPFQQRNWNGYQKATRATVTWLCINTYCRPKNLQYGVGIMIARLVYATRGRMCWVGHD